MYSWIQQAMKSLGGRINGYDFKEGLHKTY
ncbi:uncharacterized protein METZ01_LOCUS198987 [marine metagenome]|uniref:Uncharacterized protein n=1 Tax=marine metagenome TaxID=408172 RepID=A0A382E816_9ZZZZ